MLKLIAPVSKKRPISSNIQDSDSDHENISVARTSTPVKTHTVTNSKTTPVNSRNKTLFPEKVILGVIPRKSDFRRYSQKK